MGGVCVCVEGCVWCVVCAVFVCVCVCGGGVHAVYVCVVCVWCVVCVCTLCLCVCGVCTPGVCRPCGVWSQVHVQNQEKINVTYVEKCAILNISI